MTNDPESAVNIHSLNAMFRHATEGILISDLTGLILKANPSAERLFGYGPGGLEGRNVDELVPRRLAAHHLEKRRAFGENPHARPMGSSAGLLGRRKDDTEFPVEVSLSHYSQNGEPFVMAFIIDITERKKHEASILELNQELERKVAQRTGVLQEALLELERSKLQLSAALEKERELNDMKSRFVTMASHEFRTPLSTILSSVSLISKYNSGPQADKIGRHVQRIKSSVTHMTLILNDFLSAEKLDDGKVQFRHEEVHIESLARETMNDIQGIMKPGQQLEYRHSGLPAAMLDRHTLRNIFINLFSNAIKFSPDGKVIRINTTISPRETFISVSDEGMGIPEDEQQHLFEKFFRARNATNIQGTGLGLNIVAKYLQAMNGNITFSSGLDKGTTFNITIPHA